MLPDCPLLAVLTGAARPIGHGGERSGIAKRSREGAVDVGIEGLAGDEQGDRIHHGGPEKAVHHYAFDHYAQWKARGGPAGLFDRPAVFGENFSTTGMTEESVCIGDVFEVGSARLQVSQARQPCWRLDLHTGVRGMAAQVQASGLTGWYYRVLTAGRVESGDRLKLVERLHPQWPLRRLLHYVYVDPLDRAALAAIARLEVLSASWRHLAEGRLREGRVEDWTRRLTIPESLR